VPRTPADVVNIVASLVLASVFGGAINATGSL
jgi:hypothetical protein